MQFNCILNNKIVKVNCIWSILLPKTVVEYFQLAMISDSLIAKKLVVCLLRIELLHCLY